MLKKSPPQKNRLIRGEEIVLPAQGHLPYCVLHAVIVDTQVPVDKTDFVEKTQI